MMVVSRGRVESEEERCAVASRELDFLTYMDF